MRADYEVGKIADPAIQAEVAEAAVAGKLAQEQRRDDEAA
jgi:hypothetical protein